MVTHKYKCIECYKIQGEQNTDMCICEVSSDKVPSMCLFSSTGLAKWRCMHINAKVFSMTDPQLARFGDDDIWWLKQVETCLDCGYKQYTHSKKYKIIEVK